ncbi:MAG: HAMP domain-containing sensor histidine kinase [Pseudomonadota bacterium]
MLSTLSGRFLLLTIIFVMLAEILIFVPSVARFRADYLQEQLERAQIASLALLATPDAMVEPELNDELLENAAVLNIVLRRNAVRELVLATPMPAPVAETFDLRNPAPWELLRDAFAVPFEEPGRVIRVIGRPVKGAGFEIEIALEEAPLRAAMLDYALRVLVLSIVISVVTATLLFVAVGLTIVRPIRRVVDNMVAFREDPEDPTRIIAPQSPVRELRDAERALNEMQTQLNQNLKEKERLAALGRAVAKISHDLRNILTTTQLMADRIEGSADPRVARVTPKLLASLNRAISLCERTLAFGKAEEPKPETRAVVLHDMVQEVVEAETMRDIAGLDIVNEVPRTLRAEADPEQLFRVLLNLLRNARQAIEGTGRAGEIRVAATISAEGTEILVADTGPGLPSASVEHLFEPFRGSSKQGGSGLGLAISAELVRNHGGRLQLVDTSTSGTIFRITLPRPAGSEAGEAGAEPRPGARISRLQTPRRADRRGAS